MRPSWWSKLSKFLFALWSLLCAFMLRGESRADETTTTPPESSKKKSERDSSEKLWLSKADITSRLLSGNLPWLDALGIRGGKWHFRKHLTSAQALFSRMQSLVTQLETLERQNGSLSLAQQKLLSDLFDDLPDVGGELEDLGGEG